MKRKKQIRIISIFLVIISILNICSPVISFAEVEWAVKGTQVHTAVTIEFITDNISRGNILRCG